MPLHISLRGVQGKCARWLPFARRQLDKLRALKARTDTSGLHKTLHVADGTIRVRIARDQEFIEIVMKGGAVLFTIANTIDGGFNAHKRYYFYNPDRNRSSYLLETNLGDYPDIQAMDFYAGLGALVYLDNYATVYPVVGVGVPFSDHEWSAGNPSGAIRYRKDVDGNWVYVAHTTDQNLQAPYYVDVGWEDGMGGGDATFLYIDVANSLYRKDSREYTYAWSQEDLNHTGVNNYHRFRAYLVSRDITDTDLDWRVDYLVGEWENQSASPGHVFRRFEPSYSQLYPVYNEDTVHLYAETVRVDAPGMDAEIWRYDRAAGTNTKVLSWDNLEAQSSYYHPEVFLLDHDGKTCGYAAIEVAVDGTITELPDNGGTPSALSRFYAGPCDDVLDADGNVVLAGGIENAQLVLELDMNDIEFYGTPSANFAYRVLGFWRISGGYAADADGNLVDTAVYGIWILGDFSPEYYPSLLARWSSADGLQLVYKVFDDLSDGFFYKKYFQNNQYSFNMLTDADPMTGANPKRKNLLDGAITMNGSPVDPSFYTSTWVLPRFAKVSR